VPDLLVKTLFIYKFGAHRDFFFFKFTANHVLVFHWMASSSEVITLGEKEGVGVKAKFRRISLSSNRCKIVFQHLPVVTFRRSPNVRDLLVTAKLSSNSCNPQLPSRSFRCGKNCATCPYISHGLTTYTFFSTGETRPIKSNLTCDTKNFIYMIQCNRCNLQYIGETKRRLKDRFNEHRVP